MCQMTQTASHSSLTTKSPCGTDADACVHWNLFNIDASIGGLIEDVDINPVDTNGGSNAVEGLTYAGTNNYEGP